MKSFPKVFRKRLLLITMQIAMLSIQAFAVSPDYTKYVNLFIGTYRDGQTFPGAAYPFGSVQLSPDTRKVGLSSCGGYYYPDQLILGFSHTHLSGVGEPEYRDVLFMPTVGPVRLTSGEAGKRGTGYQSAYSHQEEKAIPGYYAVRLQDYNILAELTATRRVGLHRYTFPKSDNSHLIIDLAHPDGAEELMIRKVNDHEIEGLRRSHGWAWDQYVYFVAQFSKPFRNFQVAGNDTILGGKEAATGRNVKGVVTFSTREGEQVIVKVGLSAVSCEGARMNMAAEVPGWNFAEVAAQAKSAWNHELGRIEVSGGRKDDLIQFYTSMYRLCISPNLFMDTDGKYRGVDHQVHQANGYEHYTVFSLWDTFRAFHPLLTIIDQKRTRDFIRTLLQAYDDGGRLPMWPLAGNYTDDMLGYHAVPVIADAYLKGIRGFDTLKAYQAMKHSAGLDKLGLKYYKQIGYLPCDRQGESVSKTLEYCYDDWCIAQVARAMGLKEDYLTYHRRAHYYENVFDPSTGFMRGKTIGREWLKPFDPKVNSAYSEGNAYQYMFVPHDADGLSRLLGGDKKFANWLDTLFFMPSMDTLKIGEYWHGNEPGHHLPYLYDYVGEAWKTQFLTHRILTRLYRNTTDGLAGNEDCGQMSAWYIFSSLGFYPVSPGQKIYAIGSPLFDHAVIHLENGKTIKIQAENRQPDRYYIQSARLNGHAFSRSFITHDELMAGADLRFILGPQPNKEWAREKENRPYSDNLPAVTRMPFLQAGDPVFSDSTRAILGCDTEGAEIRFTLDGSEPNSSSSLYRAPIPVSTTFRLKMKAFHQSMVPSTTVEVPFSKVELHDAMLLSDALPGLEYDYFERFFVQVTDLDLVRPLTHSITSSVNFKMAKIPNYFGVRFKGFIRIPTDGLYTFYLASNDGSRLYLDGTELIENDGNHGNVEEPGTVPLKAGFHSLEIKYMQCGGGKNLQVKWSGPGLAKQEIQPESLFHLK